MARPIEAMNDRVGPDVRTQGLVIRLQRAMAHELRTPLHSMSGWLHVLESRLPTDDPMAARALAGIRRAIEQQVELADVLTATARSLGGESLPRIGPVDRLAAWHEALEASPHWGTEAGRELVTIGGASAPVEGDAEALTRAFRSLLDALAAMLPSPRRVTVRFSGAGSIRHGRRPLS